MLRSSVVSVGVVMACVAGCSADVSGGEGQPVPRFAGTLGGVGGAPPAAVNQQQAMSPPAAGQAGGRGSEALGSATSTPSVTSQGGGGATGSAPAPGAPAPAGTGGIGANGQAGSPAQPEPTPEPPLPGGDFAPGGASLCGSAELQICEGFENAALGAAIPAGWASDGYGNRTLAVVDDDAARGNRAFRIDVAANQGAVVGMLVRANIGALGARHFGRSFMKIQAPAPTGFVHWDAFEARGIFNNQVNMVRWASTGTNVGTQAANWSWIYNVQTTNAGEFGTEGPRSAHPIDGDWMCLEWSFDAALQEASFFYEGTEVDYLHIDTERAEIPTFTSFHIGFQKFQQSGAFRVWVDEVAFDAARIGCDR